MTRNVMVVGLGSMAANVVPRMTDAERDVVIVDEATGYDGALMGKMKRADEVFIVVGLGGSFTPIAVDLARRARASKARVVAFVTTPCHFEGRRRARVAAEGLRELRKTAHAVWTVGTGELLEAAADETLFTDVMDRVDGALIRMMVAELTLPRSEACGTRAE